MAQGLVAEYRGEVPRTMDQLQALPGVGRKTANVVLGNAFGINVGVTVDTHVTRLSRLLGLTRHDDPVKIEQDLMPLFPQSGLGPPLPSPDLSRAPDLHRPPPALPPVRAGGPLPIRRHLRPLAALLAVAALVGAIAIAIASLATSRMLASQWEMRRAHRRPANRPVRAPELTESSGVAASRRQPGILWTMNDSGDDAWIFATDTLGRDHGAFLVAGAENRDWEAITLGPCGNRDCLYIADTGDNGMDQESARVYRVPEPSITSRIPRTRKAEVLEFRYPRGLARRGVRIRERRTAPSR